MQKSKGSWTQTGIVMSILCVCLGIAYGFNDFSNRNPQATNEPWSQWEREWRCGKRGAGWIADLHHGEALKLVKSPP